MKRLNVNYRDGMHEQGCQDEGVTANSRCAIQDIREGHVETCVIVAIEIEESDRSLATVSCLKLVISGSVGYGRLVER